MTTVIPQQFEVKQDGTGGIGHNSRNADPGSATDLVLAGPLFLRQANVDRDALNEFCAAIRSQGNDAVRHRTIDNALVRHRANPSISNLGYRVLSAIAWVTHGKYRYHGMPMEALALFAGQASATNMGRILKGLGLADAVTCIAVPREKGGRPMNFIAIRCTAEDRTGAAVADLKQQARERYDGIARAKRDGFEWAELVQEPTRHHDELTEADAEISASRPSTISSPGRIATRHHDDQSADSRLQREEENDGDIPCTITGAEENVAATNAGDSSDPLQHGNAEKQIVPPSPICNGILVPQAILDRYFACAKDWGFRHNDPRRGLAQLDRGESDGSCLGQLIPYQDRPPHIVLMAMEMTMGDVESKRADEAALAPSAQTTFAGLSAFAKYFRKGMGGNVRTLTEQEAQAIADRAVHEARLSKRMSSVESGGAGAARQRSPGSKSRIWDEFTTQES